MFGATSGKGGLGWFIYEAKNQLEIPSVFAGLFTVIMIGLLVENLIFRIDREPHHPPLGHAALTAACIATRGRPRERFPRHQ